MWAWPELCYGLFELLKRRELWYDSQRDLWKPIKPFGKSQIHSNYFITITGMGFREIFVNFYMRRDFGFNAVYSVESSTRCCGGR